jgi:hypothetical protein
MSRVSLLLLVTVIAMLNGLAGMVGWCLGEAAILAIADPPDAAVAVGVGVARAQGQVIDVPVVAEVVAPAIPAKKKSGGAILGWERRCGPGGCELVPIVEPAEPAANLPQPPAREAPREAQGAKDVAAMSSDQRSAHLETAQEAGDFTHKARAWRFFQWRGRGRR